MSEKFQQIVNAPHRAVDKLRKKIKDTKPEKTAEKIARGAGVATTGFIQGLLWFIEHFTLDNFVTRGGEKAFSKIKVGKNKDGKDKKFPKFIKKNPNFTAIVSWWMLLASLVGVGVANKDKIADAVKDKIENIKGVHRPKKNKKTQKETINTIKIDSTLPHDQWMAQIDAIWPYIYMETVLSEGFVNEAYADVGDSGGYMTIGSGYMIGRAKPRGNKDRETITERKNFFKKVLGKPYVNGVSVSFDENRMLVRAFYEKYVWPYIKAQFTTPIDAHLFIELGIGCYNRGSGIYKGGQNPKDGYEIRKAVNDSLPVIDIVNKFDDLCKSGNGGLKPKYAVAAHRVLGHISDEDVLESYANSVYGFTDNLWQNGKIKDYPDIASVLKNMPSKSVDILKNGKTYKQLRISEYLSQEEIDKIRNGDLFTDFILQARQEPKEQTHAEKLNEQGEKLYTEGQYQNAIKKFEQAITENPNMFIIYSNMVIAYYQLEQYEAGVAIVEDVVRKSNFSSATNQVQGYVYYNGALCYEKLGDSSEDATKKLEYYNKAKEYAARGESIADTKYKNLDSRLATKITKLSAKTAFNDGAARVKKFAHNDPRKTIVKNGASRA